MKTTDVKVLGVLSFILAIFVAAPLLAAAGDSDASESANLLYMKGRQLVMDGKYEEAAPLLESALKGDPDNAFVSHQLSEIYLRLSNFERAESLGKRAVEKDPRNLEYRATLGGVLASMKKYPEAKEQYAKIIELDPTNTKAPLLLGIVEAESGELEAGIKVLTSAIERNPDNYMAHFYRAKIYLEMENVTKAKGDLEKCLVLRPNFVEAGTALGLLQERLNETDAAIATYGKIQGNGRFKKRLAQLYLQKNEFNKALGELLDYEQVEPDDYTARVKIGLIHFELKQYDKALERFKLILKEQPEADNVRFYTAAVYEELKQFDSALVDFKKVSKDSAFFKESMLHVGFIYKEQGKLKDGLEFSKKLLVKAADVVEFHDMHASFYESMKEYGKALKVVVDGLKRFPGDEKLLYFQGALNDKLGERKKAIENMRAILATNANNAHALNFLGYTYAEMGENLEEAEKLVRKALEIRPNDGYIEDSLGWILYRRGKYDESVALLEKAVVMQPEEAVILEHLGDAYLKQGSIDKAVETYKKAVASTGKKDRELGKKLEAKIRELNADARVPSETKKN